MKLKRFGIWAMCILVFVSFTLTGASADNLKSVTIISAAPGGAQYPLSVGLMGIITNNIPGVTATVDASSGGASQNVILINKGLAEIGFSSVDIALVAYQGVGDFEGQKCDNLRSVIYFSSYLTLQQIIAFADSPLMEMTDIDGRRIVAGLAGGGHDVLLRSFCKILGIKPKIINVAFNDGADMLRDHRVDALYYFGGTPSTTVMDLETLQKIKLVPVSKESAEKILSGYPYVTYGNIPAETYKSIDQDVPTLTVGTMLCTNKDVPAEFIYDFLEAVFKNQESLKAAYPKGAPLYKQDAVNLTIPLHVGALEYYKDNGIDIPERLILSE